MINTRRQLTLFLSHEPARIIEQIRQQYNPIQFGLIPAHVTLCREDELTQWAHIQLKLKNLSQANLTIDFLPPIRFAAGKGVFIPAKSPNESFDQLRKFILKNKDTRPHKAHITLMHPRNSTCTDAIFKEIIGLELPSKITFDHISLIEQINGGSWTILESYAFNKGSVTSPLK